MGTLVMSNFSVIVPFTFLLWIATQAFIGIRHAARVQAIRRRLEW